MSHSRVTPWQCRHVRARQASDRAARVLGDRRATAPASVVTSELTAVELACTARRRGLLNGTYVSVEAFHLFRYLDERVFTFSLRELDDFGRFSAVLKAAAGRRLTYAELTGRSSVA